MRRPLCPRCHEPMVFSRIQAGNVFLYTWLCDCTNVHYQDAIAEARHQGTATLNIELLAELDITRAENIIFYNPN